jgi:membrane glycosyltransferase
MTPRPWQGLWRGMAMGLLSLLLQRGPEGGGGERPAWERAGRNRRRVLLTLILGSTALGFSLFQHDEPVLGHGLPAALETGLFALLFAWVSAGFYTALMGFVVLVRGGDRHGVSLQGLARQPLSRQARTAILMPICNEDIGTVFGGLRATCESLAATGMLGLFDIYVLSDTSDPALRDAEIAAWKQLRVAIGDGEGSGGRLFYRWRRLRTKRKAGNVADFCRRWGRDYRYMVILDADSVMTGDSLVSLVRLMEAHPRAGILQTAPRGCGHDTLHARAQAFVGRVTGRLFTAGLAYWQLGESHYWGHNAILRVEPFMRHCALAKLPGRGGLSGEILSHDFVEAALMRRAGYEVWLVPDVEGSFEQQPPNLIDELTRDRRWCQGNLQNTRLIAEPGMQPVHRAMFVTGAMSYIASPLWLAFVLLGLTQLAFNGDTASADRNNAWLWATTAVLLLLPRVLGVITVVMRGEQAAFGGLRRLMGGAVFEALLSALQAPVRMVAHSVFVMVALTGLRLHWKSPSRNASDVRWRDAASRLGAWLVGLLAVLVLLLPSSEPAALLRIAPLAGALLFAVPLAVWTSRVEIGAALRARRMLLIPEETAPGRTLTWAWLHAQRWLPALPQPMALPGPTVQPQRRFAAQPAANGAWLWRAVAVLAVSLATPSMMMTSKARWDPEGEWMGELGTRRVEAFMQMAQARNVSEFEAMPIATSSKRKLRRRQASRT